MSPAVLEDDDIPTARRVTADPGIDFLELIPFESLYRRLILHACSAIELTAGPECGQRAKAAILRSLPLANNIAEEDRGTFERRARIGDVSLLDDPVAEFDWQEIAGQLIHLFIFARHGESQRLDPAESRVQIEQNLEHFRRLVAEPGMRSISGFDWFTDTLAAAEARWAIDNGLPVLSEHLAALAGVRMKTLANLIAAGQISVGADGKISVVQAVQYLDKRKNYIKSTWQEAQPSTSAASGPAGAELTEQVFVPVDSDGGPFLPSMARRGRDGRPRYIIGEKSAPEYVEDYWEALLKLSRMSVPRWRRPASGAVGWSLVTAQDGWRRFPRASLAGMVDAMGLEQVTQ